MVLKKVSQQREKLIKSQAEPYLDAGEEVLHWVRAAPVEGRGHGFVYLTEHRVIVHLTGRAQAPAAVQWDDLDAWGVAADVSGGPVLGLKDGEQEIYAQLRCETPAMTETVRRFIAAFAELAPEPRSPLAGKELGDFEPVADIDVSARRLRLGDQVKRVVVTVLGALMIILALVIVPLPGPWSILLAIAGFAVLASEYDWAKDALSWARRKYQDAKQRLKRRRAEQ